MDIQGAHGIGRNATFEILVKKSTKQTLIIEKLYLFSTIILKLLKPMVLGHKLLFKLTKLILIYTPKKITHANYRYFHLQNIGKKSQNVKSVEGNSNQFLSMSLLLKYIKNKICLISFMIILRINGK